MAFKGGYVLGPVTLNAFGSLSTEIGTNTNTGTVTIGNTNSGAIRIDCGTAGLAMGTTANAHTVSIGSTSSTSTTLIQAGTGSSSFQPTGAGSLALGTTNTGATTLGNLTGTTTINFGGGSALSTYVAWTSWTPTIRGNTTAGVTTHTIQVGTYSRIGNIVCVNFTVAYTAATGTGTIIIGGLPLAISSFSANHFPIGSIILNSAGTAWPVGTTKLNIVGLQGTTDMFIQGVGNGVAAANVQLANTATTLIGSLVYRV